MDITTMKLNLCDLTCRICLQNHTTLNSLYDDVTYHKWTPATMELRDLLRRVAQVEIAANESTAPTRICSSCTEKLVEAFEFVNAIAKSELLLRECLRDTKLHSTAQLSTTEEAQVEVVSNNDEDETRDLEILDDEFELRASPAFQEAEAETEAKVLNVAAEGVNIVNSTTGTSIAFGKRRSQIGSRLSCYQSTNWHSCVHCTRTFAKQETLKRHIQMVHRQAPAEHIAAKAPKPTSKMSVPCDYCPRLFARNDTLLRHMRALHPKELKNEEEGETLPEDRIKQEQNDYDDEHGEIAKDTMATTATTVHQKLNKNKHNYKRGLCPHCGQSFSHASLIIHIRRHTGEKPYQCDTCEKGFPRRQDLTIHQRQHTGERPHICTVCGKSFIRPNKLARHMRIHTGQRPYKCDICSKAFAQSNDLKIHQRRHTGEKPYKCGMCDASFICGTALNAHRKAKAHTDPEGTAPVDPYAKIRVNNRTTHEITKFEIERDVSVEKN